MRKVIHVMWGAALGFCLILSAASVMAASNETVGVVSFDTTQVFVRFTGPFLGTSNPYNHSKNATTRVSLDANNDGIKDDWRSGLPPVEAIPNEYVFAHLFLNVMPEQVGGYNDVISARGSMEFPFRFDVRSNRMLQFRSFFQAEDGAIPGAVSLTTVFQSTAPTDFSVAVSDALEAPETYYLGAVLFQVAEIDFCKGVTTHRDEVQPIAPQVDDKPDRIADMVVRLVPPVPPQLAYEDMTKLHLLELCLTGPVDTPEGKVWRHVRSWMRTRRTGNPPSGAGGSIRVAFQPGGISGECAGKPSTQENPRRKPDEAESPRLPNGSVSGGTRANAAEVGTHKVNNYIYLFSLPGFF